MSFLELRNLLAAERDTGQIVNTLREIYRSIQSSPPREEDVGNAVRDIHTCLKELTDPTVIQWTMAVLSELYSLDGILEATKHEKAIFTRCLELTRDSNPLTVRHTALTLSRMVRNNDIAFHLLSQGLLSALRPLTERPLPYTLSHEERVTEKEIRAYAWATIDAVGIVAHQMLEQPAPGTDESALLIQVTALTQQTANLRMTVVDKENEMQNILTDAETRVQMAEEAIAASSSADIDDRVQSLTKDLAEAREGLAAAAQREEEAAGKIDHLHHEITALSATHLKEWTATFTELEKKTAEVQAVTIANTEMDAELGILRGEKAGLERKVAEVEAALQEAEATHGQGGAQMNKLAAEHTELEGLQADAESTIARLNNELDLMNKELAKRETDAEERTAALHRDALEREEAHTAQIAELEAEITKAKAETVDAMSKASPEGQTEEMDRLRTEVESLTAGLENSKARLAAADRSETEAAAKINSLDREVRTLTDAGNRDSAELITQQETLQAEIDRLVAEHQALVDEAVGLRSVVKQAETRADKAEGALQKATAAGGRGSEDLERLSVAHDGLVELQADAEKTIADLHAEVELLNRDRAEHDALMASEVQALKKEAEEAAEAHATERVALEARVMEARAAVEEARSQAKIQAQPDDSVQRLTDERDAALAAHAAAETEATARIKALDDEVRAMSTAEMKDGAAMVQRQEELERQVNQAAVDIEKIAGERDAWRRQAEEVGARLEEAEKVRDDAMSTSGLGDAELARLRDEHTELQALHDAALAKITELHEEMGLYMKDQAERDAESARKVLGVQEQLQEAVDAHNDEKLALEKRLADAQTAAEDTGADDQHRATVARLERKIEALEEEIRAAGQREGAATDRIAELNNEVKLMASADHAGHEAMAAEAVRLTSQLKDTVTALEEREMECADLRRAVKGIQGELEAAQDKLGAAESSSGRGSNELRALEDRYDKLEELHDGAVSTIERLKRELDIFDRKQTERDAETDATIAHLEQTVEDLIQQRDTITGGGDEAVAVIQGELADAKAELHAAAQREAAAATRIADLDHEVKLMAAGDKEDRDAFIAEKEHLNDELQAAQAALDQLRAEYDLMRGSAVDLEGQLRSAQGELGAVKTSSGQDDDVYQQLVEKYTELNQVHADAVGVIESLKDEMTRLHADQARREDEAGVTIAALEEKLHTMAEERDAVAGGGDEAVAALNANVNRMRTELTAAGQREMEAVARITQLNDELMRMTAADKGDRAEAEAALGRLQADKDAIATELREAHEAIIELEEKCTEAQGAAGTVEVREEELKAQLHAVEAELRDVKAAGGQGDAEIARMQAEHASLVEMQAGAKDTIERLQKEIELYNADRAARDEEAARTVDDLKMQLADMAADLQNAAKEHRAEYVKLETETLAEKAELQRYKELASMAGLNDRVMDNVAQAEAEEREQRAILAARDDTEGSGAPTPTPTPGARPRSTLSIPDSVTALSRTIGSGRALTPTDAAAPLPPGRPAGRPSGRRSFLSRSVSRERAISQDELKSDRAEAVAIEFAMNVRRDDISTHGIVAELTAAHDAAIEAVTSPHADEVDIRALVDVIQAVIRPITANRPARDEVEVRVAEAAVAFPHNFVGRQFPTPEAVEFAKAVAALAAAVAHSEHACHAAFTCNAITVLGCLIQAYRMVIPDLRAAYLDPVPTAVASYAMYAISSLSIVDDAETRIMEVGALPTVLTFLPTPELIPCIVDPIIVSTFPAVLQIVAAVATCEAGREALMDLHALDVLHGLFTMDAPQGNAAPDAEETITIVKRYATKCMRNAVLGNSVRAGPKALKDATDHPTPNITNEMLAALHNLLNSQDTDTRRFAAHTMAMVATVPSRIADLADLGVLPTLASMLPSSTQSPDTVRNCIACLMTCAIPSGPARAIITDPAIVAAVVSTVTCNDLFVLRLSLRLLALLVLHGGLSYEDLMAAASTAGDVPVIARTIEILSMGELRDRQATGAHKYAARILTHFYGNPSVRADTEATAARIEALQAMSVTSKGTVRDGVTAIAARIPAMLTSGLLDLVIEAGQIGLGLIATGHIDILIEQGLVAGLHSLLAGLARPLARHFSPEPDFDRPQTSMSIGAQSVGNLSLASTRVGRRTSSDLQLAVVAFNLVQAIVGPSRGRTTFVDTPNPFTDLGIDAILLVASQPAAASVDVARLLAFRTLVALSDSPVVCTSINSGTVDSTPAPEVVQTVITSMSMPTETWPAALRLLANMLRMGEDQSYITEDNVMRMMRHAADTADAESAALAARTVSNLPVAKLAEMPVFDDLAGLVCGESAQISEIAIKLLAALAVDHADECIKANVLTMALTHRTDATAPELRELVWYLGRSSLVAPVDHMADAALFIAVIFTRFLDETSAGALDSDVLATVLAWVTAAPEETVAAFDGAMMTRLAAAMTRFKPAADAEQLEALFGLLSQLIKFDDMAVLVAGASGVVHLLAQIAHKKSMHPLKKTAMVVIKVLSANKEAKKILRTTLQAR